MKVLLLILEKIHFVKFIIFSISGDFLQANVN